MSYLILSTYGESGSRNSGDDLICKSLILLLQRVKGKNIDLDVFSLVDDDVALVNMQRYKAVLVPAMRPTVQGSKIVPQKRPLLLKKAKELHIPVYAIGAGWGSYPGSLRQAKRQRLYEEDKTQLIELFGNRQVSANGLISCRDFTTELLLKNNGINCYGTTGDCALFDTKSIGQSPRLPEKIKSIAVSLPHNIYHWNAAYKLAKQLKKEFTCTVYITFHGYYGVFDQLINQDWNQNQFIIKDLSGGSAQLSFYQQVDVHIGFRLHAHIWYLRKRKPSLLIAEDGRGMGHLLTVSGLGYSAASLNTWKQSNQVITYSTERMYAHKKNTPNIQKAIQMFKKEHAYGYPLTKNTFRKIDKLWEEQMLPFIKQLP